MGIDLGLDGQAVVHDAERAQLPPHQQVLYDVIIRLEGETIASMRGSGLVAIDDYLVAAALAHRHLTEIYDHAVAALKAALEEVSASERARAGDTDAAR